MKIMKKTVDALEHPTDSKQYIVWDDELPGFGIRVSGKTKTYFAQARVHGRERRISVGRHGVIAPDEARKRAKEAMVGMSRGVDPIKERKRDRALSLTVQESFRNYLDAKKDRLKPSTVDNINIHLDVSFKNWQDRALAAINRDHVSAKHKELSVRGPAFANQGFRVFRAVWNFARETTITGGQYILPENPCRVLSTTNMWNRIEPKNRKIPLDKIGHAWNVLMKAREGALNAAARAGADLASFLVLTGARFNEAASLTWGNVSTKDKYWRIPDPKNRRGIILPLSDMAVKIVESRPVVGDYVFAWRAGRHIVDIRWTLKKVSHEVDEGGKLSPHDLRRTFRAVAGAAGIEFVTTKMLMNHVLNDVTVKHYTETADLRYLAREINLISKWIELEALKAAAGNVIEFPQQAVGE